MSDQNPAHPNESAKDPVTVEFGHLIFLLGALAGEVGADEYCNMLRHAPSVKAVLDERAGEDVCEGIGE